MGDGHPTVLLGLSSVVSVCLGLVLDWVGGGCGGGGGSGAGGGWTGGSLSVLVVVQLLLLYCPTHYIF